MPSPTIPVNQGVSTAHACSGSSNILFAISFTSGIFANSGALSLLCFAFSSLLTASLYREHSMQSRPHPSV
jgi:hypothetical protein